MTTNNKAGENTPSPVTPLKEFSFSSRPVLHLHLAKQGAAGKTTHTEIECKIGDCDELLLKFWPEKNWEAFDYSKIRHCEVGYQIILRLLNTYWGLIESRSAQMTISDRPEPCRTDVGNKT